MLAKQLIKTISATNLVSTVTSTSFADEVANDVKRFKDLTPSQSFMPVGVLSTLGQFASSVASFVTAVA